MILVFDIGGSAIKSSIIDDKKDIFESTTFEVPSNWEAFVSIISEIFNDKSKMYDIEGVSFSAPGSVNSEEGVIYGASAINYIHGPNFKEIFEERLKIPVEIENDANCAALAESYFGENSSSKMLSFVVLGSGVGGANIMNQEIIKGTHLHGGEFGYTILKSKAGRYESFSTLASVGGLIRQAQDRGLSVYNGIQLFELEEKSEIAKDLIASFYNYLAVGLFNIQYTYDPDVIVLGGAISKREDLLDRINKEIDKIMKYHDSATLRPKIKTSKFGNDANLLGAYINYKKREGKNK